MAYPVRPVFAVLVLSLWAASVARASDAEETFLEKVLPGSYEHFQT